VYILGGYLDSVGSTASFIFLGPGFEYRYRQMNFSAKLISSVFKILTCNLMRLFTSRIENTGCNESLVGNVAHMVKKHFEMSLI
jgi:hypothetical protein